MYFIEFSRREIVFSDIEIKHAAIAEHQFKTAFRNGRKLKKQHPIARVLFDIRFYFIRRIFVAFRIAAIKSAAHPFAFGKHLALYCIGISEKLMLSGAAIRIYAELFMHIVIIVPVTI